MQTYVVQHPVKIALAAWDGENEGEVAWGLYSLDFSNEAEDLAVNGPNGDDGEYACWDASVQFVNNGLEITGADGPCGGSAFGGVSRRLIIAQHLITEITTEDQR